MELPEFDDLAQLSERWRAPWRGWDLTNRREYINNSMKQPWCLAREYGDTDDDYAPKFWKYALWHRMVAPDFHGFLTACGQAVSDKDGLSLLGAWRGAASPLNDICAAFAPMATQMRELFDLYFDCAQALGPWTWLNDEPDEAAFAEFVKFAVAKCCKHESLMLRNLPENFWIDLRDALLHPKRTMRPGSIEGTVGVLVLAPNGEGKMATLVFEAIPTSQKLGQLYPSPKVALVWRDPDFLKHEQIASSVVTGMSTRLGLKSQPYDVRWSLRPRRPDSLPSAISGPSASAAQGLLLATLAARAGSSL
jgi:hypothetical protein